jgi:transcriptional regulator NrdR family protein
MYGLGGRPPLRMECPRCGARDHHPVVSADPVPHYRPATTALFKARLGRDIFYRTRRKRCLECGEDFETAEMATPFLEVMVGEIVRLRAAKQQLEQDKRAREEERQTERDATKALKDSVRDLASRLRGLAGE